MRCLLIPKNIVIIWRNQLLCLFLQTESKDMERNLLIELLHKKRYADFIIGALTYTRKSCHFRSQKESDNEAQDKNRARV